MTRRKVTLAHISKMHTIIGKLEYLQNILPNDSNAMKEIAPIKRQLMRVLDMLESEHAKGQRR